MKSTNDGVTMNQSPKSKKLENLFARREFSLLIILAAVVIILSATTNSFLTAGNVRVLLQGMSTDMMIAIPMAISLIAGNIDFSVGSTLCLTGALVGMSLNSGVPTGAAILIGLGTGALFGFANGVIVNKLKVTPLVATLGTWMAYKGAALVIAGGAAIGNFSEEFTAIGRVEPLGIPIPIIYMLIIIALGMFAVKYIPFFHNAYFIGSNSASARLAGINTEKFTYISYTITGIVAAFAGMVLAARLGSASQNSGDGLEFRNVVGLLIGGISMDGGEGKLLGAVMGIILMQLVNNAIVLLYLNSSYTKVITGCILVFAVAIDQISRRAKAKGKAK